ncbi:hypothetical protein BJ741DRAFT_625459 [Chytriomyces cf. hyalinus JEL632]|nr:hypothetical protein BJ741DRAFT_625459 [Chytriomyces cf. hyalinus JEL632]
MTAAPKTVVITGSSRGIGRALTEYYISNGWNVIATARNATSLAQIHPNAHAIHSLDTADAASINAFSAKLDPSQPVHLLINNAGILLDDTLHSIEKSLLMQQFETNAVGPLLLARALIPNLKLATAAGSPALVANISSMWGSIAENDGDHYGYRASKTALNSFMKSLSIDLKPENISVISMCPGWVKTDMAPTGAISTNESVAGMSSVISNAMADSKLSMSGGYFRRNGDTIPW